MSLSIAMKEHRMSCKKEGKMIPKQVKRVVSLFSGCGGMDLGFEGGFDVIENAVNSNIHPDWINNRKDGWINLKKLRYHIVFANDIKESARKLWCNYFNKYHYVENIFTTDSIVDLVKREKASNEAVFPEEVDVVIGGFPCQDFSVAGKRNGLASQKSHKGHYISPDDPTVENRGQLYIWMKEVIEITKPKVFIAENVKGLMNLDNVKDIIQSDFSKTAGNGYTVLTPRILFAPDYGIPQTRERIFFIGFRKDCLKKDALEAISSESIAKGYDPYPIKTHGNGESSPLSNSLIPYTTAAQALKGLKEPDEQQKDLAQIFFSKAKYMGKHCQGQKEIDLKKPSFTIRSEHHGNIEFRRLSIAHGGKIFNELNSGLKERRLTVRECARLQTFPDDFEFVIKSPLGKRGFYVNPSDAYKAVGNAVPPLLAYHIAARLEDLWEKIFLEE